MEAFKKSFLVILLVGLSAGTIYYTRIAWSSVLFPVNPCKKPLTYSIGEFDERFGITREKFLTTIRESEKMWEDAHGAQLFTYSATGTMKINLMYDYRQQTTQKLNSIGVAINEDKEGYEEVKARYAVLRAQYDTKKAAYEKTSAAFDRDKDAHEENVRYWNDQGGAPEKEYAELREETQRLNSRAQALNQQGKELNSLSEEINGVASILNELAQKLNMKVDRFNTIGASTGEEFNEGEYVRDSEGIRINVYQFETITKLRRLLVHELGHTLGLDHVTDAEAMMYRLNSGTTEKLTAADLAELQEVCEASPQFPGALFR
jgi:hypothetical protein